MPKRKQNPTPREYKRRFKILSDEEIAEEIAYRKAQQAARYTVQAAIKNRVLPDPHALKCILCPARASRYHHTDTYFAADALKVVPVCVKCHGKLHSSGPPKIPFGPRFDPYPK